MLHIRTQTHTRRTANTILLAIITIVVGSVGCLGAFFHKVEAFSQVFTVTTTSDSGAGSLRQAILDSNAAPSTQSSPNEIVFDIANADSDKTAVQTISLQSALPQITQPLVIDGTTQQGAQCGTLVPTDANGVIQPNKTEHTLMVEVTGVNTAGLTNIFSIADSAAGSGLRGLVVNGATDASANDIISRAPSTTISCSYVGTKADGTTSVTRANTSGAGIRIDGSAKNSHVTNTLVSGQGGIGIQTTGGQSNVTVDYNLVGTDASGKNYLANSDESNSFGITYGDQNNGSVVRSNVVNSSGTTIYFGGTSNNVTIAGNRVDTDLAGLASLSNAQYAVRLNNGTGNIVGGPNQADRNVIGTNQSNSVFHMSQGLIVQNNYVGLKADGSGSLGSVRSIYGNNTSNTQIIDNTIVSSADYAVLNYSRVDVNGVASCQNQLIKGNYIGVTKDGLVLPNSQGIDITCENTQIIDNVISGNTSAGITNNYEGHNYSTTIHGNIIGLKSDGVTPAGNGIGVALGDQAGTTVQIGGAESSTRNVIAGNTQSQIVTTGSLGMTKVQGNYICVDKNGQQVANSSVGIQVRDGNLTVGGSGNGEGNVINCAGSNIQQNANSDNPINYYGNTIGLNADGETPGTTTSQQDFGIDLRGNVNVQFGGDQPGQGNVIAGMPQKWGFAMLNLTDGMHKYYVQGNRYGVTASGKIVGNYGPIQTAHVGGTPLTGLTIGGDTMAAGNIIAGTKSSNAVDFGAMSMGDGIVIGGSNGVVVKNNSLYQNSRNGISIYGDSEGNAVIEYNSIHDNAGVGVGLSHGYDNGNPDGSYDATTNNTIRFNSIYKNTQLGIDLGPRAAWGPDMTLDSVTTNDDKDEDNGPNYLQNHPMISYSVTSCDGTTKTTPGGFNSTPNTTFILDYYSNPSWQTGQPMQGEQYLSTQTVTTDSDGNTRLAVPADAVNPTITATDPSGNTSEFGGQITASMSDCKLDQPVTSTTYVSAYYPNIFTLSGFSQDLSATAWVDGTQLDYAYPQGSWDSSNSTDVYTGVYIGSWADLANLAPGLHDVTIEITDNKTGISAKYTYKDALKIVQPTINYNTTVTDNTAPTLSVTPRDDVQGMNLYTILPAGAPNNGSVKPYAMLPATYKQWTDSQGHPLSSATSWRAITEPKVVLMFKTIQQYGLTSLTPDSSALTVDTMPTLNELLTGCDTYYEDRALSTFPYIPGEGLDYSNWNAPSAALCRQNVQAIYDDNLSDAAIANIKSTLNFAPLPDGKYDVYFRGVYTPTDQQFSTTFPGGLIVDTVKPQVAITTVSNTVSPALTGTVNKNTMRVKVKIAGKTYTATVIPSGDWYIPAGMIDPLAPGEYTMEVTATDALGKTATTTTGLTIKAAPSLPAPDGVGTVGATSAGSGMLSATGDNIMLIAGTAVLVIVGASVIIVRNLRCRQ